MKKHYFMLAANIMFIGQQGENETPQPITLITNAVVGHDSRNIDTKTISKFQQLLYVRASEIVGGPVEVLNLAILNIMHLGHLTEKEFFTHEVTQDLNNGPIDLTRPN